MLQSPSLMLTTPHRTRQISGLIRDKVLSGGKDRIKKSVGECFQESHSNAAHLESACLERKSEAVEILKEKEGKDWIY